jgi:hypothetical protein
MNVQQVWQSQATEAPRISLAYVQQQAGTLERRARWRNALEYCTAVFACGLFLLIAWQQPSGRPIMLAALACSVLWALWYLVRWHQLASVAARPEEAGVLDTLRYQRRQLERQRDARRGSWRWWGLPALPAYALFIASLIIEMDPVPWIGVAFLVGWLLLGGGLFVWYLESEARRFQREIDALDSLSA